MSIDLSTQRGLSPKEAAAYFPSYKDGAPCHPSKVVRLITKGIRLPDDTVDRLEALRFGNQWVTTLEAIREFGERVAAAKIGRFREAKDPSPARRRSAEQADRELAAAGF